MKYMFRLVSLFSLAALLAACASAQPVATGADPAATAAPTQSDSAYPVPMMPTRDASYPAPPTSEPLPGYPAPQQEPTLEVKLFEGEIVPFVIATPLKAGATEVKGTGPKGVPVVLTDITFQGEVLGSTVVQEDGTFRFEVKPLQDQHRLGVKLGEFNNPQWNSSTFNDDRFYGPGYMPVPQDSFYFDTALVEP